MTKNNSPKIKERIPYGTPLIEPYNITSIIAKPEEIETVIDKRLARLQKQGVNINQCTDYLESIVEGYIAKLETTLEGQRASKKRFLTSILLRRASDRKDFVELQTALEAEIKKTEEEFKLVKMLREKCNPLYK